MTNEKTLEILHQVSSLISTIGRKYEAVTWLIAYFQYDEDYNIYRMATFQRDQKDYKEMLETLKNISAELFRDLGLEE